MEKGMGNVRQRSRELAFILDVQDNMTFEYRFPVNKKGNHDDIWGKSRGTGKCKGPEARVYLIYSNNSLKVNMIPVEWAEKKYRRK